MDSNNTGTVQRDSIEVQRETPPKKSSFPWWIIPLILLPLIVGAYFMSRPATEDNNNSTTPTPTQVATPTTEATQDVTPTLDFTITPTTTVVATATP